MDDLISRQAAIDALRKALYEYEDKTEKQFQESEDLDVGDWILHRIFVQNMSDIDGQAILNLPAAQPEKRTEKRTETHACDLIDREAAVDAIYHHLPSVSRMEARLMLHEVPSAQAEQRWIPCSERLPKDNRQVLVYARSVHYALAKYDEMRNADGTYKKQWVTFDAWKPLYTIKEVIAWMPLPEPYKGGEKDE